MGNNYRPHAVTQATAHHFQPQALPRLPSLRPGIQPAGLTQSTQASQELHVRPAATIVAQQYPPAVLAAARATGANPQPVMHVASQPMASGSAQHATKVAAAMSLQQQQSPPAVARALDLNASPIKQVNAAGQSDKQKAVQPLQSLTNDLTSRILSEQANQLRQLRSKKGTALLDLVPTVNRQLQSKAAKLDSNTKQAETSKAQPQQLKPEQHCDAFVPAVRQCIDVSGQVLCKPYYQQAAALAVQHGASQQTATASVQALHSPPGATALQQHASDAQLAAQPNQGAGSAEVKLQPRQATASASSDDLFLGTGQRSREELDKAHRHIAEDLWTTAVIGGELCMLLHTSDIIALRCARFA